MKPQSCLSKLYGEISKFLQRMQGLGLRTGILVIDKQRAKPQLQARGVLDFENFWWGTSDNRMTPLSFFFFVVN